METKDWLQIVLIPLITLGGNFWMNKKNNEMFKRRKVKEEELVEIILKNYNSQELLSSIGNDSMDWIIDEKFRKLKGMAETYLEPKIFAKFEIIIDEYCLLIKNYWIVRENIQSYIENDEWGNQILDPVNEEKFQTAKNLANKKFEELHRVLNKIFYS